MVAYSTRSAPVDAVRLLVEILIVEAVDSIRRATEAAPPGAAYDPYSLAAKPIPPGLRIHPHPRGVSAEAARRITGGAVG